MTKTQYKSIIDRYKQSSKGLLSAGVMVDNTDLSKNKQRQAKSHILAFFVSEIRPAPQADDIQDTTHLPPFLGVNHHIYALPQLEDMPCYDGVTLQNRRKLICRAVTVCTESEPHHPMIFHSVVTTQKTTGGHIHA